MPEDRPARPQRSLKLADDPARGTEDAPPSPTLRIAFFVSSFPELSETFIARQVIGMLDRGHEVRIFARRAASAGPVHESVERRGLTDLVTRLDTSRPTRTPRSAAASGALLRCLRPRRARATGGWTSLARTVGALAHERAFDVVHCHYGEVGTRYAAAACVWHAPLVVSFYGYDCSSFPREHGADVYRPLFGLANAVTSLSGHMDERLRALGCPAQLLRRVPLSVDSNADVPLGPVLRRHGTPVRLLTVARLTEKKGIEHALRALALLGYDLRDVEYDVVGEGPLRPQLEALTNALGLRGRVRFHGALTERAVRAAMSAADIFMLPSVTAANGDEEGTPTVLLEAAYARLPVIATRHAGIPEIVLDGQSAILVPERDPGALADALRSLVGEPRRWQAMGDAGRRLVEESHAVPVVAGRLESIYLELLRARRRAASGTLAAQ
jgi:colanic acid/amylovoran biosynthesis glycosyltransferase